MSTRSSNHRNGSDNSFGQDVNNNKNNISLEEKDLRPMKLTQLTLQEQIDAELAIALAEEEIKINDIEVSINNETEILSDMTTDDIVNSLTSKLEEVTSSFESEVEVEIEVEVEDKFLEDIINEEESSANVLSFSTNAHNENSANNKSSSIDLSVKVNSLNFSTSIDGVDTHIQVVDQQLIEIEAGELQIHISPESGCIITTKSGLNFTIPLSLNENKHKKKAS